MEMVAPKQSEKMSPVTRVLIFGAVVMFVVFAYVNRQILYETYQTLLDIQIGYVLLLPVIQIVNYFLIGNYYRSMFERFDVKISAKRSWGVVAAMNFVNQVLPSGGLSGISYLAYGFRAKISTGKTTLIQVGRYLGAFGSYALMVPFVAVMLVVEGNVSEIGDIASRISHNGAAAITVVLFVIFSALMFIGFRSQDHSHKISHFFIRVINVLVRPFRNDKSDLITNKRVDGAIKEFHEGVAFFRGARSKIVVPLGSMWLSTILEMAVVYVSLLAVGSPVDPSVVFIAFVAANAAGVISVIPGDVGVHEAVVIFVLGVFSVPVSVALSATLLYRVFNKIIFLPIGFYFYTAILKPATK